MAAGGAALARDDDGRVVFVDGALPGELVDAEVYDEHVDYAKATVVSVHEPAEGRIAPPCPYVGRRLRWMRMAAHRPLGAGRAEARDRRDALRRIGRLASADVVSRADAGPTGYRTTVRMGVSNGRRRLPRPPQSRPRRHRRCLVAHPLLADLIEDGRYGDAREVTLRCGAGTGERLVLASPHRSWCGCAGRCRGRRANEVKRGRTARFHETIGGRRFTISATSFFQARPDGAEAIVDAVRDAFVDDDEQGTFVDAYCGVGVFAGLLGDDRKVVAVERNGPAVRDARQPGRRAQVDRAEVAAWNPVPARVVVADPARPGLGGKAAARLAATGATRLILVSCDPASLGRDVAVLTDLGFAHGGSTLVDLFPHTPHVEVVTRFDRVG